MPEYQRELAQYNEAQSTLPAMEDELRQLKGIAQHAEERAANEISEFRLAQVPKVAELEYRASVARDRDVTEYVDGLLSESVSILSGRPGNGFEEFLHLLLAAAVNEKCQEVQPIRVSAVAEIFMRGRDEVETGLAGKLDEIARPWFAAVISTRDAIACGKVQLDKIKGILNKLSEEDLIRKREQLASLQRVPLPPVPEYKELVSPDDLDRAGRECFEGNQSLSMHLAELVDELGEGGCSFDERVTAVQTDANQVLSSMLKKGTSANPIANGIKEVLTLAARATPLLGAWTKRLCDSLQTDAKRRLGIELEDLIQQAIGRSFYCDDAKEVIHRHPFMSYLDCRASLRDKLEDSKRRAQDFQEAATGIKGRPDDVRAEFHSKYRDFAVTALLPFGNLRSSFGLLHTVSRLQDALGSTKPAYACLASEGPKFIRQALFWSLKMCLVLFIILIGTAALLGGFSKFLEVDPFVLAVVLMVVFTYPMNVILTIVILRRWRSFVCRSQDRSI